MILPNKCFRTDYGRGLRSVLSERQAVKRVIDFGAEQVFDATTYTCLLFLGGSRSMVFDFALSMAKESALRELKLEQRGSDSLTCAAWIFADQSQSSLIEKLKANSRRLLDLPADMSRGSSSGDDKVLLFMPKLRSAASDAEKAVLQSAVTTTDAEIDRVVYDLYGLTPEEIAIVEGA